MSRVLITGGAGFIGSHLAMRLADMKHVVTVIDCLSPQIHSELPEQSMLYKSIAGKVRFIRGDVCKLADMASALKGQDVVVHLAAETGTGQSMYEIDQYSRINVGGTALLLDILANTKTDVKRVVVASSRAVYGEGKYLSKEFGAIYPKHRSAEDMAAGDFSVKYPGCAAPLQVTGTDEQSKLHPSSVYGITKQVQEQLVLTVCPSIKLEPVVLRYQNVYGPGQSLSNPYTGILSIFSGLILTSRPVNVFEDGTESRDFVFIDDVVDATVLAVEKDAAAGEVFNVGAGKSISILRAAEMLVKSYGGNSKVEITGNFRIGDIRHNYADISKISNLLGFNPSRSFEQGLSLFCDWVRAVGAAGGNYQRYQHSLQEMGARGLLQ